MQVEVSRFIIFTTATTAAMRILAIPHAEHSQEADNRECSHARIFAGPFPFETDQKADPQRR
jgi:hypothetical protein